MNDIIYFKLVQFADGREKEHGPNHIKKKL